MTTSQQKRLSLSIHLPSSGGPRPLQLVNSPRTPRTPLATDDSTCVNPSPSRAHYSRHGSARRQSSISYNSSSPAPSLSTASKRASLNGPISSPPLTSPPLDATSEEPEWKSESKRAPTLMEQHSSLLTQIAQREQKSLELKAQLQTNEEELATLKRKWTELISGTTPSSPMSSAPTRNPPPTNLPSSIPIPNIADPFYGLTSPTFNGLLQEGAKGVSRFLSSLSAPNGTEGPNPPGMRRTDEPTTRRSLSSGLRRKPSNRDSSSSSGSGTSQESSETDLTSVEDGVDPDKPLIDFGSELIGDASSFSATCSRESSLSRRRSMQRSTPAPTSPLQTSILPSSPLSLQDPLEPSPHTSSTSRYKRHSVSPIQSSPGLGLVGIVGGLFGTEDNQNRSPLTLTQKRSSGSAKPSSLPASSDKSAKRSSASVLGSFNWDEMLTPSTVTPSNTKTKASPPQDDSDEWNW
ncbi:hypothetical protein DL96DRAFT_1583024 [Flagelloscypha sp. PMI_526]|nr:hypothetical protein DL96DRAFT_1583024 [Flagelloscypha sp. PMI_526]